MTQFPSKFNISSQSGSEQFFYFLYLSMFQKIASLLSKVQPNDFLVIFGKIGFRWKFTSWETRWQRTFRSELCLVTVKLWIILVLRKLFNIKRFETLGKEWFEVCHLQDHSNPKFRYILVGFLEFLVILTIKRRILSNILSPLRYLFNYTWY